jgi:phosphoribosylaminoimidazole-succinocarboxamide synthase
MMREPAYSIDLPHVYSGKVRDIFDAGDGQLLMVTSDRISAFDVVMNEVVPGKGRVLTAISAYWFDKLADIAGNHLISTDLADFPKPARVPEIAGRTMLVHKAEMLPIECIVRGYITGSAWKEYQAAGTMHGTKLGEGLLEADQLGDPVFTPSTKADDGLHDENISFDRAVDIVGKELAEKSRDMALALYSAGRDHAANKGIIIADTKFEFGFVNGDLVVADELLTPDSSRFWPANEWKPGSTPPSYDKQPVRDHLDSLDWNKQPPPPSLPDDVISESADRYEEAYMRVTGQRLSDWPG